MVWEEPIRLDGLSASVIAEPVVLLLLAGLLVWLMFRRTTRVEGVAFRGGPLLPVDKPDNMRR